MTTPDPKSISREGKGNLVQREDITEQMTEVKNGIYIATYII